MPTRWRRRNDFFSIASLVLLSVLLILGVRASAFVPSKTQSTSKRTSHLFAQGSPEHDLSTKEALQRTAAQLERLHQQQQRRRPAASAFDPEDPLSVQREQIASEYLQQSANALKAQLKARGMKQSGRKPDLARRLAEYDMQLQHGIPTERDETLGQVETPSSWEGAAVLPPLHSFAGLTLSETASISLGKAGFDTPSPIQAAAIPALVQNESLILHAETGSGKTLCYVLPITETLWQEQNEENPGFYVILTPTRELASQVAGIASVLAPPGSVRLVSRATNLLSDGSKERGELEYGGRLDDSNGYHSSSPRLFVGSAKAILHSLYGDGIMPASPTPKPTSMFFLRNVRCLVLDEVDRLLLQKKSRRSQSNKKHERPAAVVAAAVARLTLGRSQVVSASATVGRPLKRELSRVLGLEPQEVPRVVRVQEGEAVGRAVTIPSTVHHYVLPVDGEVSIGKLLTSALGVVQWGNENNKRRMLLVLTRGCGISSRNAIGALKHFRCNPEPIDLLSALEASGTDELISIHRQVAGVAVGVGESSSLPNKEEDGYLLVTGEDTVRGLHLDGLDTVIVVGRPAGPDEYTHIAGRTGRAGLTGNVVNVVSRENAALLKSWERMLDIEYERLDLT